MFLLNISKLNLHRILVQAASEARGENIHFSSDFLHVEGLKKRSNWFFFQFLKLQSSTFLLTSFMSHFLCSAENTGLISSSESAFSVFLLRGLENRSKKHQKWSSSDKIQKADCSSFIYWSLESDFSEAFDRKCFFRVLFRKQPLLLRS